MKRLNIVVPYRAREGHLKTFIRCETVYKVEKWNALAASITPAPRTGQ
jgi:hypothetical protein